MRFLKIKSCIVKKYRPGSSSNKGYPYDNTCMESFNAILKKEEVNLKEYETFEDIIEYVEFTAKGYCKCMKWENIKALLRLAVVNNRLTKEQAEFLEKEFCIE